MALYGRNVMRPYMRFGRKGIIRWATYKADAHDGRPYMRFG